LEYIELLKIYKIKELCFFEKAVEYLTNLFKRRKKEDKKLLPKTTNLKNNNPPSLSKFSLSFNKKSFKL
jgi:hypothetical protein